MIIKPGTPLPWAVENRLSAPLPNIRVLAGEDTTVAKMGSVAMRPNYGSWDQDAADAIDAIGLADAAYIEVACNAYPDLVEALETIVDVCYDGDECSTGGLRGSHIYACRAALAKARGESQ